MITTLKSIPVDTKEIAMSIDVVLPRGFILRTKLAMALMQLAAFVFPFQVTVTSNQPAHPDGSGNFKESST